jgi:hypothetical protein
MNSNAFENQLNSGDELLTEYCFNYQKAKPNRFAKAKRLNIVVLDEDVAKASSLDNLSVYYPNLKLTHESSN